MKLAIFAALALVSVTAHAARPDSRVLTCNEAKALVQAKGSVVMTTGQGSGGPLYQLFMANFGQCGGGQRLVPGYAPTLDKAQCFVGYVCQYK